ISRSPSIFLLETRVLLAESFLRPSGPEPDAQNLCFPIDSSSSEPGRRVGTQQTPKAPPAYKGRLRATPELQQKEIAFGKKWINIADAVGASSVRVFGGGIAQ